VDRVEVIELARVRAEPAVSVLCPVAQPVTAHPEDAARLRSLLDRAVETVGEWRGAETAAQVRRQLEAAGPAVEAGEHGRGLAVLATPDDCRVLHLPFPVEEQIVVDDTFATRQLLEGLDRTVPCLALVLGGGGGRLLAWDGVHPTERTTGGFPVAVTPPHEWDTPHRDLPIHEGSVTEERRTVFREVDRALGDVLAGESLPVVVLAPERDLALFAEVGRHGDAVVGQVHGSFEHASAATVAEAVQPALRDHLVARRQAAVARLRDAHGRGRAVVDLAEVGRAAEEGRGHELVLEEGFSFPRHRVDGLTPGEGPDVQLAVDDVVDDVVETVLLHGGEAAFVEPGALDPEGHIGLILRGR
jgi:hypothetical protein